MLSLRTRAPTWLRALGHPGVWASGMLLGLSGCEGDLVAVATMMLGTGLGAWVLTAQQGQASLREAQRVRRAIGSGQHRVIESELRRLLEMAAAGEGISAERQWLARVQLGGLLVAEWRLDEAAAVYGSSADLPVPAKLDKGLSPVLAGLTRFGQHEVAVLRSKPTQERLKAIRTDAGECVKEIPNSFREVVADAWSALEGLCLARLGDHRQAEALLARGVERMHYTPARVIYLFHWGHCLEALGDRERAEKAYAEAEKAFPGTRLAKEASARLRSLSGQAGASSFRGAGDETAPLPGLESDLNSELDPDHDENPSEDDS